MEGYSVAGFSSVTNRQYNDLLPIVMIPSDICALSKLNHEFPKSRGHIFHETTDLGMRSEYLHALTNCLHGAQSRIPALRSKKLMQSN